MTASIELPLWDSEDILDNVLLWPTAVEPHFMMSFLFFLTKAHLALAVFWAALALGGNVAWA